MKTIKLKITTPSDHCTTANVLALCKELKPLGCRFRGHFAIVPENKINEAKGIVTAFWGGIGMDEEAAKQSDRINQ